MKVSEICSRPVFVVRVEQALSEAAQEMEHHHVGALVVLKDTGIPARPVGIITDRDIVCGQYRQRKDLSCMTVGDVMSTELVTVHEHAGLSEAIETLRAKGVRRAPVVNAFGELVGIVTLDDLLPALASEMALLAKLIGTQAQSSQGKHA